MKADNNHNMKSLAMGGEFTGHHTRSQGPPDYTEMAADNSPPVHECLNKPGKQNSLNRYCCFDLCNVDATPTESRFPSFPHLSMY